MHVGDLRAAEERHASVEGDWFNPYCLANSPGGNQRRRGRVTTSYRMTQAPISYKAFFAESAISKYRCEWRHIGAHCWSWKRFVFWRFQVGRIWETHGVAKIGRF
jgi:hypothetical protein